MRNEKRISHFSSLQGKVPIQGQVKKVSGKLNKIRFKPDNLDNFMEMNFLPYDSTLSYVMLLLLQEAFKYL